MWQDKRILSSHLTSVEMMCRDFLLTGHLIGVTEDNEGWSSFSF